MTEEPVLFATKRRQGEHEDMRGKKKTKQALNENSWTPEINQRMKEKLPENAECSMQQARLMHTPNPNENTFMYARTFERKSAMKLCHDSRDS